jgi:hypothetical protein
MRPSQTIARAGDDSDASVKPDCHEWNSWKLVSLVMPGLVPGIHVFLVGA